MPYIISLNLVNINSGNGLKPDGTKPLPEPVLTYTDEDFQEYIAMSVIWKQTSKYIWKLYI